MALEVSPVVDPFLVVPEVLHLYVRPDVSRLPSARATVRAFLVEHSVDEASREDILLAVQEALKNAVRFSGTRADIDLLLSVADGSVRVVVKDKGRGFDRGLLHGSRFVDAPDPLATEGRGLYLMAHLMDEVRLASTGGAEVRMIKRLAGPRGRRLNAR